MAASARRCLVTVGAAALACAAAALAPDPVRSEEFTLAPNALAETPDGRDLLRYLASCALPEGVTALIRTPEGTMQLEGGLGLAPEWRNRGLAAREAELVSACVLARVNHFGESVEISMRADPALADPPAGLRADADERAEFPLHEGAFFGNLFEPGAPAFVCQGAAARSAPEKLRAARRVCALPTGSRAHDGRTRSTCGFIIVGPCQGNPEGGASADRDLSIHVYLRDPVAPRSEQGR